MRERLKLNIVASGIAALALLVGTGCKPPTKGTQGHQAPGVPPVEAMVQTRIADSASQILDSLTLLAKLSEQDALVKGKVTAQPAPTDPALLQPLPMIWDGPLEPAVKTIAKSIGWRCEVTGSKPIQPVIVQIRSMDTPVQKVIESFGWQAGNNVAVMIDEGAKLLKIVYLPENDG